MKFTLTIETDHAHFADEPTWAVADALSKVVDQLRDGHTTAKVKDPNNGIAVGEWALHEDDAPDERNPAQEYAASFLARTFLPDGDDEVLCSEDVLDSYRLSGKAYLLGMNGPTVTFYMVKDNNGQEEFGVVEHILHEPTYAVIPQHQAEVIDLALRTPRKG